MANAPYEYGDVDDGCRYKAGKGRTRLSQGWEMRITALEAPVGRVHEEFRRWRCNLGVFGAVGEKIFAWESKPLNQRGMEVKKHLYFETQSAKSAQIHSPIAGEPRSPGQTPTGSIAIMKVIHFDRARLFAFLQAILLLVGTTPVGLAAGRAEITQHAARLQLADKPADAQQVAAVQKQLVASKRQLEGASKHDVVVVGQIGGMPNVWPETHPDFPWYKDQASFFLVDSKVAAQFATHAKKHGGNHNCSFCQSLARKNAHAIAVVNLVDEADKPIAVDSRELLGVKENQTVIVRGKAKLLGGRLLVIDADGIHVARDR